MPGRSEHLTVLADAEEEVVADAQGSLHGLVIVSRAVGHVDPGGTLGRAAHGGDAPAPQQRFAALAFFASGGGLVRGRGLADEELLVDQAEEALAVGGEGEAVVLQKALAVAVADGSGPVEGVMRGEVEGGGVVVDQNQGKTTHALASQFPVWALKRVDGGADGVTQAVEPSELVPVEDLGEGLLGVDGDEGDGSDQAARASGIAQVGSPEVLLRPLTTAREEIHDTRSMNPLMSDRSMRCTPHHTCW